MAVPPTGTVTFLFTDIEGSTLVIQDVGDTRYAQALADHRRLLLETFHASQGYVVETQGDAFLVAFPRARDAVLAAVAGQQALAAHAWPEGAVLRVRMGLHTGEPAHGRDGYVGIDLHRAARICAAAYGGQILVSAATRGLAGDELSSHIGFRNLGEHRLKDLAMPQLLYQVIAADLPSDFPPPRSLNVLPNNLPVQLTTFVGRERDIAEVIRLLSASRLLTLTGPGGGGKTRLALQVAAELLPEYRDGVWLAELATLTDPTFLPQTVAAKLSVREQPGRPPMATLAEYLRSKSLLLILDNSEHVIDTCALLVDELLHTCPGLHILATSREALHIPGEIVYAVPPLSLPEGGRPSIDDLTRSEAGRLFIERATLARPGLALQNEHAATLAQICSRLDGNPLAIELAAARVKVLSIKEIASRLDDLFRLLTEGGRTTLPRHRTLEATIDWSHNLLTEQEKILFRRLSVFAGGWTLDAAEEVCAGDGLEARDVLDLQARLVEKSLVIVESQVEQSRYRMLETIQEYSRGKLSQSGEAIVIGGRHLDWFLSLAERAKNELRGPNQAEWLNRLDADHGNFRVALKQSLIAVATDKGLRLAGALGRFWYRRGHLIEGRKWLESVLARGEGAPASVRAEALYVAGRLATGLSDYDAARAFDEESLRIFREIGDKRGMAESLHALSHVAEVRGDYAAARSLCEESLAIFREIGDRRGIAVVLIDLGRVTHMQGEITQSQPLLDQGMALSREIGERLIIGAALHALAGVRKDRADYTVAQSLLKDSVAIFQQLGDERYIAWSVSGLAAIACSLGKYDEARRLYEDSLRVFGEVGDRHRKAESLQGLGDVMHALGDLAGSRRHYEESLSLYRSLNHTWGSAEVLCHLGSAAIGQGDQAAARSLLEESLRLSQEVGHKRNTGSVLCAFGKLALLAREYGHAASFYREALVLVHGLDEKRGVAACLEGLAAVAVGRGQLDHAAKLYAAAGALREVIGAPLPPAERAETDRSVAALGKVAGASRFGHARSEGRAMTLDQAVACALNDPDATKGPQQTQSPRVELKGGT